MMPENLTDQTGVRGEDWFLAQLEKPGFELRALTDWLGAERTAGRVEQAGSLAEFLQDTLVDKGDREGALAVLRLRASWEGDGEDLRGRCADGVLRILGSNPEQRALVQSIGLEGQTPLAESFRRLDVLRSLKPGVLCHDKTWGVGVVESTDWFYKRVDVDFDKKPHHQMSFAYAAEALELLADDHLLAYCHRRPDDLKALVANDPAEVVRIALRSFGPMPAPRLQEVLVPDVVAAEDWKRFWETARRGLKKDPLVQIPARRTDPILLLKKEKSFDGAWFRALAGERDMERILQLVAELKEEGAGAPLEAGQLEIVGERLAFVVKGAGGRQREWVALAAMLARELGVAFEWVDTAALLHSFLEPETFLGVATGIPARDVKRFLAHLDSRDHERTLDLLLQLLPQLESGVLSEAMELLFAAGREQACAAIVHDLTVEKEEADVEIIYWLFRHPEFMERWHLGSLPVLARWALRVLEKDHSGERLKAQHQLRSRFEQKDWLKSVMDAMTDAERRELVRRVKESPGWTSMDRRSLLGFIVKSFPELQEVLTARETERQEKTARGPLTSHRSYRERQAQLERLVQIEIPALAREIGQARSYGDLSENYEYKAAKEKQGLLLRRRGELETMLHSVRPTDFAGLPCERAGLGTGVLLEYPDGRRERYYILGAWDRDEALGIISSDSRLAKGLEGRRAGEQITIATEGGQEAATIREVTALSQEVRDWVNG